MLPALYSHAPDVTALLIVANVSGVGQALAQSPWWEIYYCSWFTCSQSEEWDIKSGELGFKPRSVWPLSPRCLVTSIVPHLSVQQRQV